MIICFFILLYRGIRAYIDRDHTTRHVLSTPSTHHLLPLPFPGGTNGQTDRQRETLIVRNSMTVKHSLRLNITTIAKATLKEQPILVLFWGIMYRYLELNKINNQTVFGNVEITYNSSRLDEADFVVIHFRSIYTMDVPKKRHSWQKWVVHSMEPPSQDGIHRLQAHRKPLGMIDKMFNFTSHYSKKADIRSPYGECYKIKKPLDIKIRMSEMNKTGLVLWASSHCITTSEREKYVDKLKKSISVDIHGKCGTLRSSHSELENIRRKYKFYLSFENSFCQEYVSEKPYDALFLPHVYIIPVVMGLSYHDSPLPPASYIDVRNFTSPHHLAEYLKYLDKNDTAFMEYFTSRRNYECRHAQMSYKIAKQIYGLRKVRNMVDSDHITDLFSMNENCITAAEYRARYNIKV